MALSENSLTAESGEQSDESIDVYKPIGHVEEQYADDLSLVQKGLNDDAILVKGHGRMGYQICVPTTEDKHESD